jgi:hypothetical protein
VVVGLPSVSQLSGALLSINDMPTGYSSDNAAQGKDSKTGFCNMRQALTGYTRVGASFEKSEAGPLIGEVLRAYASSSRAEGEVLKAQSAASSCTTFSTSGTKASLHALSYPAVGDKSFAVQLSAGSTTSDLVIFSFRNVLVEMEAAGLGTPNVALLQRFTDKALSVLHAHQSDLAG